MPLCKTVQSTRTTPIMLCMKNIKNLLYLAWVQALVATLGSLYFSEILHFKPCILCWYQRILMYPLVIIIAVGILRKDKNLPYYVLPMSILGAGFALFHVLLQKGIIPENFTPCEVGVSCTTRYAGWFGFLTIPMLSLIAFLVITVCMYWYKRNQK